MIVRTSPKTVLCKADVALFAVLLVFVLGACAESPISKNKPNGIYRFKDAPLQLNTPQNCIGDLFVAEGARAVGFMLEPGYWMVKGYYEVQVLDRPSYIDAEQHFFKDAYQMTQKYMAMESQRRKMHFQWQGMEFLDEYPLPAFQTLGVDPKQGTLIATFVLREQFVTIVSLQYPREPVGGSSNELPWACYNRFLESIKDVGAAA